MFERDHGPFDAGKTCGDSDASRIPNVLLVGEMMAEAMHIVLDQCRHGQSVNECGRNRGATAPRKNIVQPRFGRPAGTELCPASTAARDFDLLM